MEQSADCKKLDPMGLNLVLFSEPVAKKIGCLAGIRMFLHENAECRDDMTTVFLHFYGFA